MFRQPEQRYEMSTYLGLLGGLNDDTISGVVEFPGNYTQKFSLVLIAIVIWGADAYKLRAEMGKETKDPELKESLLFQDVSHSAPFQSITCVFSI